MKRAARRRLAFAATIGALLALALWQWRHDETQRPAHLLALTPDDVTRIELHVLGDATERYVRHDGRWQRVDAAGPVDVGRLHDLTAIAAATVLDWRPASDFDPRKIGLVPPQAVLRLDDHVLEFGEQAATGPQRYVRVDGAHVALVSATDAPRPARGHRLTLD